MEIEYAPGPQQDEAGILVPAQGGVSWCHLLLRPVFATLRSNPQDKGGRGWGASARAVTGVSRLSYDTCL